MYTAEIGKIRSRLPALLANKLDENSASEYQSLWKYNVSSLRKNGSDKKIFFRDTLIMTSKLNRRFEIDSALGNLIRKMILAVFMEDENAVPAGAQRPYSELISGLSLSGLDTEETPNDKHIVFTTLLTELSDVFDARFDASGAMKVALTRNLAPLSVPIRTKSLLEKWAKSRPFSGSFNDVRDDELRLTIDLLYTLFCDQWGPSVTDRLMAQALGRVETIPEAKSFPPQRIL